jgi:hypothetical protein
MDPEHLNREQSKGYAVISYIQGTSKKLNCVPQQHGLKVMQKQREGLEM